MAEPVEAGTHKGKGDGHGGSPDIDPTAPLDNKDFAENSAKILRSIQEKVLTPQNAEGAGAAAVLAAEGEELTQEIAEGGDKTMAGAENSLGALAGGYNTVTGIRNAYADAGKGNVTGAAVNSGKATLGAVALAVTVAKLAGKSVPEALEGGLGKVNVAAYLVASGYEISHTNGSAFITDKNGKITDLGPKGDKALEMTVNATVGIATSSALGTAGAGAVGASAIAGGGIAGGAAAAGTVLLPLVIAGVTAYTATQLATDTLQTHHAITNLENDMSDRSGLNTAFSAAEKNPLQKPDIATYGHLPTALQMSVEFIRYERVKLETVTGPDGKPVTQLDLSDPQTRQEAQRAIDMEIQKQQQIVKDNSSVVPDTLRGFTENVLNNAILPSSEAGEVQTPVTKKWNAQLALQTLEPAKDELGLYDKDLAKYLAAQQTAAQPIIVRAAATIVHVTAGNEAQPQTEEIALNNMIDDPATEPAETTAAGPGATQATPGPDTTSAGTQPPASQTPPADGAQAPATASAGTQSPSAQTPPANGAPGAAHDLVADSGIDAGDVNLKRDFEAAADDQPASAAATPAPSQPPANQVQQRRQALAPA